MDINAVLGKCKSTIISLGMFSAGHFNSTFLLTMFNTPPLFNPGESGWLINLTGISKIIFFPHDLKMECKNLVQVQVFYEISLIFGVNRRVYVVLLKRTSL